MKTQKLICLSLSLLLSFPLLAQQQEDTKKIEAELLKQAEGIELLVVDPDSPLLSEDGEVACEEGVPKVYDPNTGPWSTIKHIVKDTGGILVAPIGWSKEEWLKATAIVAGVMLLSTQDKNIKDLMQSARTPTTDFISHNVFEKLGNGGTALPALGLTYAASLMIKNEKLQNTTLTALESATIAAVLTTIGKHAFHRTRPYKTDNPHEFDIGNFKSSNVSFPSGHTGTAFAIATVFAEAYKDKKIIPILAYSAATLAGLSRIHDNKHWASDVAMGAVLGYAAGKFVSNRRLASTGISVTPSVNFGPQGGVNVSVKIPIGNKKKKK